MLETPRSARQALEAARTMPICDAAPPETENTIDWLTLKGADITLNVPELSPAARRAPEELRDSEHILQALKKLLSPDDERASAHIELYIGSPDPPSNEQSHCPPDVQAGNPPSGSTVICLPGDVPSSALLQQFA